MYLYEVSCLGHRSEPARTRDDRPKCAHAVFLAFKPVSAFSHAHTVNKCFYLFLFSRLSLSLSLFNYIQGSLFLLPLSLGSVRPQRRKAAVSRALSATYSRQVAREQMRASGGSASRPPCSRGSTGKATKWSP